MDVSFNNETKVGFVGTDWRADWVCSTNVTAMRLHGDIRRVFNAFETKARRRSDDSKATGFTFVAAGIPLWCLDSFQQGGPDFGVTTRVGADLLAIFHGPGLTGYPLSLERGTKGVRVVFTRGSEDPVTIYSRRQDFDAFAADLRAGNLEIGVGSGVARESEVTGPESYVVEMRGYNDSGILCLARSMVDAVRIALGIRAACFDPDSLQVARLATSDPT